MYTADIWWIWLNIGIIAAAYASAGIAMLFIKPDSPATLKEKPKARPEPKPKSKPLRGQKPVRGIKRNMQRPEPITLVKPAKKKSRKRFFIVCAIAAAALIVLLVTLNSIKTNQEIAEWFTRNVSRWFVEFGGRVASVFPWVSLFEVLILAGILVGIALVVRLILSLKKRRYLLVLKALAVAAVIVLAAVNYYTVCAGFSYYRADLALPMADRTAAAATYRGEKVLEAADWFYEDFIAVSKEMDKLRDEKGNTKSPYTPQQLSKKLQKEFKRLDGNGYFFKYTPRAKVIQNSWFMSSTRISGIAFLPGGEPNINGMPHSTSFPQVMAHEIAHTKGVMRENEANLVSYYVLLTSLDPYLRYCGYLETITWMRTAAGYGGNLDADGKLLDPSGYFDDTGDLDPGGKNFSRYSQMYPLNATIEGYQMWKFWSEYKSPLQWADDLLEKAGEFFNDLYLKLSGVKEGTDSYRQPDNPPVYIPPPKPTDPPAYSLSYNEIQRIFFMIYEERAGKG